MAPRADLLSDSDSDGGTPAARPATSRPKSKSAPPKSAKTAVQAGRARASVAASDDGMDSDASDEPRNDDGMQAVLNQLTKQVFASPPSAPARARPALRDAGAHRLAPLVQKTDVQKKADKKMQRSVVEFELTVGTALSDLSNTLDGELAEHDKRCKAMQKSTADSLKKIRATEDKAPQPLRQGDQAAQGVRTGGPGAGPQDPKGRALTGCKKLGPLCTEAVAAAGPVLERTQSPFPVADVRSRHP